MAGVRGISFCMIDSVVLYTSFRGTILFLLSFRSLESLLFCVTMGKESCDMFDIIVFFMAALCAAPKS